MEREYHFDIDSNLKLKHKASFHVTILGFKMMLLS